MNIVDPIVEAAVVMKIMESDTFDINFRGTMGKLPLHHASEKATPAIVEMLVDCVIRYINKSPGSKLIFRTYSGTRLCMLQAV
jgi:hypothetical protein